jgi:hypothetical protein
MARSELVVSMQRVSSVGMYDRYVEMVMTGTGRVVVKVVL